MDNASPQEAPLGIYIHWPYCTRICPYCDFNVYKDKAGESGEVLVSAICADLTYWAQRTGPRALRSVHFGGGTPSLLTAPQISKLLTHIDTLYGLPDTAEIALEANPGDSAPSKWQAYRAAGINRLSLGVQSFDDSVLGFLGRDHDGAGARQALELAARIFPRVSADLIFGHKGQSEAHLAAELTQLIDTGIGHISAYQLTIEPGTAFARAAERGQAPAVDNDASGALYDLVRARLTGAGFDHYEISNFARAGQRSAHNLIYWQGHDYLGLGPGAHGRVSEAGKRLATTAHMKPKAYTDAVAEARHGADDIETLTPEDHGAEYVMMGLRIDEGISLSRYQAITGQAPDIRELQTLLGQGLVRYLDGDRIAATDEGRPLLDYMTRLLLVG